MCPMCGASFSRDAIESHELSIEHVIPESLGGTLKTLTCTKCNNKSGTMLEAHLVRRFTNQDFMARKSTRPLRGEVMGVHSVRDGLMRDLK